ncbi:MAG: SDR family oxidoreductase [Propionibacteriaceae bacterium]
MKPLVGRHALVTGGTRGIGAAVTEKLVAWGASVTAGYVDHHGPAAALATRLGPAVEIVRADLTDPDECAALITASARDGLDIVVHCAAAATYGPATQQSERQWNFTQESSLATLRTVATLARPALAASSNARLITISNTMPRRIVPGGAALAVAKAGVETLTSYLAYEFAADEIVVNAVAPALVPTDVLTVRPDYARTLAAEQAASPWPKSRTTQACDVADVIAALCLPELGWVSGHVIPVDGGSGSWGWLGSR